jgi:uncharacterized membrane protein (DUF106 family)
MPPLPPLWFSKLERSYYRHKPMVWIVLYLLVFFIWPLVSMGTEQLDPQLIGGIHD